MDHGQNQVQHQGRERKTDSRTKVKLTALRGPIGYGGWNRQKSEG